MGKRLEGKAAIVTGAGSVGPGIGNGKATAIVFAREGARVMLVDLNQEAAEETKKIIDEEGGDCFVYTADVAQSDDCQNMAKQCAQLYDRIDILHNNVGIQPKYGGLFETSEQEWDTVIDTDLKGYYLCCQAAGKRMV